MLEGGERVVRLVCDVGVVDLQGVMCLGLRL